MTDSAVFHDTSGDTFRDAVGAISSFPGGGGGGGGTFVAKRYFNKPAGNITRAAASVGAFSTAWQITGVVVASGQNVYLRMFAATSTPSSVDTLVAFLRGSTQIASNNKVMGSGMNFSNFVSLEWIDENPGAGTYTYEVQAAQFGSGTLTVYQNNPSTDTFGGSSIFIAEVYTP